MPLSQSSGPLQRLVAEVRDRVELLPAVGADDDVRDRVGADGGRQRRADRLAQHRDLEAAQRDRLLGAERAQQVVPPRPGRQHDAVGREEPLRRLDALHAAVLHADLRDVGAEAAVEAVAGGRRVPAEAHLLRVGEAAVGLVRGAGHAVQRQLRLGGGDLARLEEARVEAESLQQLDVAAARLDQPLGHRQQVAAADVAGVGHAHLVAPPHDRARAGDREARRDGVRVVPPHHREGAPGVARRGQAAVEQRHPAGTVAAQRVRGRQAEDARADDRDIGAIRHPGSVRDAIRGSTIGIAYQTMGNGMLPPPLRRGTMCWIARLLQEESP